MESHIEQEESDSSRQSADLRIRKTQVNTNLYHFLINPNYINIIYYKFRFINFRKILIIKHISAFHIISKIYRSNE